MLCHQALWLEGIIEISKQINVLERSPEVIVVDKCRLWDAALQETGRWVNNWAENSDRSFRRPERAKLRFRHMQYLQRLSTALAE